MRPSALRTMLAALAIAGVALGSRAAVAQEPLPPAKSVRAPHCSLKGAKTVQANRYVRVFKQTSRGYGKVYGCLRSANRAFELGYSGECQNNDEIRKAEVAGRRAVLGIFECSLHDAWWRVDLVNLRDGRREFTSAPISAAKANEATHDTLHRVAVTADGAVAWTAERSVRGVRQLVEVRRRVRGTTNRALLLDSGTDIDPGSLRRRDRTISWTKGGVRRSAQI